MHDALCAANICVLAGTDPGEQAQGDIALKMHLSSGPQMPIL